METTLEVPQILESSKTFGMVWSFLPHIGPTHKRLKFLSQQAMINASKALGVMTRTMESLNRVEIDIDVAFIQATEEEVK
ncbi:hypothetical protein V6N13_029988 [Hibiscus sabdariffa]